MTLTDERPQTDHRPPQMLWLDLTRKCQLECTHCFNASGPDGGHGTMTRDDWTRVLDEASNCGVERVQLIGGEPTMHPAAIEIACHALDLGMAVEVYSNLVHVPATWWDLFLRAGVSIATSYYGATAEEHNAVTERPTHRLTRGNIARAVGLGIPIRVGVIDTGDEQRAERARRDLETIGVTRISIDRVRAFGRAADGQAPDTAELCGRCGTGRAAIGPTGGVSPCAMSSWISVGNVHDAPLAAIVDSAAMAEATSTIGTMTGQGGCEPDDECTPGTPGSECNPKA